MGSSPLRALKLTSSHMEFMQRHVDACLPLESCGLLAGNADGVRRVISIANEAHSPVRYRMAPAEQLEAFNQMEVEGLDLLGIFHSHPVGPDGLSATDIAEAAYPVVYLVWSHRTGDWQARGFRIEEGRISEVDLQVTGSN